MRRLGGGKPVIGAVFDHLNPDRQVPRPTLWNTASIEMFGMVWFQ
jgi:hypothetical protein